jgi:hypothetical protein
MQRILVGGCLLFGVLGCLAAAPGASAFELQGLPLYLQGGVGLGYSGATAISGYSGPTLMQWSAGISVSYRVSEQVLAGLSTDLSFARQYNEVVSTGANFRGWRWNIVSPTVGLMLPKLVLLADLEFLGAYHFSNAAAGGADITYKSPLGGRLRATTPVWEQVVAGVQGELLSFGTQGDSVAGDSTFASRQTLWQAGLIIAYTY